jgi:hypothetical protein
MYIYNGILFSLLKQRDSAIFPSICEEIGGLGNVDRTYMSRNTKIHIYGMNKSRDLVYNMRTIANNMY